MSQDDKIKAKLDKAADTLAKQRDDGIYIGVDNTVRQRVQEDNRDSEEDLHDPQITPRYEHDQEAFTGSMAGLNSDDDIDRVSEEYLGKEAYESGEELQIEKKIDVVTKLERPGEESSGED